MNDDIMRYWYDWEFDENGITINPISLGIVAEDGRELYLINEDYMANWDEQDQTNLDSRYEWLKRNVLDYIDLEERDQYALPYLDMADAVLKFISKDGEITERKNIELWGHFAAYDHVCLAQLWGSMINLPKPIPMYTNDDMTIRWDNDPPWRDCTEYPEHHALYDAKFQKLQWEHWMWG